MMSAAAKIAKHTARKEGVLRPFIPLATDLSSLSQPLIELATLWQMSLFVDAVLINAALPFLYMHVWAGAGASD